MKTDKNFRMRKSSKRALAQETDPVIRSILKRMLIDSQVHAEIVAKRKMKDDE
jgi:hypothetical protein